MMNSNMFKARKTNSYSILKQKIAPCTYQLVAFFTSLIPGTLFAWSNSNVNSTARTIVKTRLSSHCYFKQTTSALSIKREWRRARRVHGAISSFSMVKKIPALLDFRISYQPLFLVEKYNFRKTSNTCSLNEASDF